MTDDDETSASYSNNKNLFNRKFFTDEDVLVAVWDSAYNSSRDSEFSDRNSKIDSGNDEIVAGISKTHNNETCYKDSVLTFDASGSCVTVRLVGLNLLDILFLEFYLLNLLGILCMSYCL